MCWPRNWVQESPILFKGDLFLLCHCHGKLKSDMDMLISEVSIITMFASSPSIRRDNSASFAYCKRGHSVSSIWIEYGHVKSASLMPIGF
jgi:hypothetical protein